MIVLGFSGNSERKRGADFMILKEGGREAEVRINRFKDVILSVYDLIRIRYSAQTLSPV